MRFLKGYLPLLIAAILVLALFIVPVAAELKSTQTDDGKTLISNGTYWIAFDPIGDHIVGDQFYINGTTNLSAGSDIYYEYRSMLFSYGGGIKKSPGTFGHIILKLGDSPRINTFSLLINTTNFKSTQFIFLFELLSSDNQAEIDAFNNEPIQIDSSIQLYSTDLRGITERSRTTHPDAGISYWMSVSNMVEYTRPCYILTGTTNLPPGETLSYSFLEPSAGVQGLYRGGIVVPGEKIGINRFIISINTSNSTEWINVIIWNPRYNASVFSDSISTSTEFRPSMNTNNVSTTCLVTRSVTTPASPLSMIGVGGAFFVVFCVQLLTQRKEKRRLR